MSAPAEFENREREILEQYPGTRAEIAESVGLSKSTIADYHQRLKAKGFEFECDRNDGYTWRVTAVPDWFAADEHARDTDTDSEGFEWVVDDSSPDPDADLPDLSDTRVEGSDPDPDDLTDRERVLVHELRTGATPEDLQDELDVSPTVLTAHLRDLKRSGGRVYVDETDEQVALDGDHNLRSSEHTGTRTRKANRWWEARHSALVREFAGLETPTAPLRSTDGAEDWIVHLTDLHAGDRVRDDDGTILYQTEDIPEVVDYITEQALRLADKHGSEYDTCHLLWGGDMVTNSGIYEGQFEDLDAWLDEQHETVMTPLVRQLKTLADAFPTVNVVAQVGNHGEHRASGTSRQANADLILYKSVRNVVAHLREHAGLLENVNLQIGQATAYKNFALRDGELTGHLRHGQHRRPQAETSARKKEWLSTLRNHDFDLALAGHHHVSGRVPWDGPPILFSPSPKPSGEFVERLGETVAGGHQGVATVCGVSDDGLTAAFPVDTRRYS